MKAVVVCDKFKRKVGRLAGDVYHTRRGQEHFMLKFQGFGLSECVIHDLLHAGCTTVQIHYEGAHGVIVYGCPLADFAQSQKQHVYKRGRKRDPQRFVSARDMAVVEDMRKKGSAQPGRRRPEPNALQGSLFR